MTGKNVSVNDYDFALRIARRALAALGHDRLGDAQDVAQEAWVHWTARKDDDRGHLAHQVWCVATDLVRARARELSTLREHPGVLHQREDRELDQDLAQELLQMLLEARSKRGERGLRAAQTELEIIRLAMTGRTNREIGQALGLSENTVKTYRQRIRKRLRALAKQIGGENDSV